jgi:DNA mismatch repair protein MutS
MSLYEDYESYALRYKAEYGDMCIVLYRCGQFYEIYSINDGLVDIKRIAELLNIQISRRNKAILEVNRSNTLMAGFPMFALRKFVNILVENNYTVVIVDQVSDPPKPKRAVTEVISPGTLVDGVEAHDTNNLMCIYIEEIAADKSMCIGCSVVDLSTGLSKVYETGSKPCDVSFALDEIYRVVVTHNPKEVLVFGTAKETTFEEICSYLEIDNRCVHNKLNNFPTELLSIKYQSQMLEKLFPKHGLYSVAEYLDLERKPFALTSYVYLIQFAVQHNDTILNQIGKPDVLEDNKSLILQYNSVKQLNIVSNTDQKQNSLLHILNNCKTALGRRHFKDRLLNPVVDPEFLERQYDRIDALLQGDIYSDIAKNLGKIYDLERLVRKMVVGRFQPADFCQIDESVGAIQDICDNHGGFITRHLDFNTRDEILDGLKNSYLEILDMDEVAKYYLDNVEGTIFKRGIYQRIDELQDTLDGLMKDFDQLVEDLNGGNDNNFFKLDHNERDGFYLLITAKRFNEVKGKLAGKTFTLSNMHVKFSELSHKSVSASSTSLKISHKAFSKVTDTVVNTKQKLRAEVISEFKSFTGSFIKDHENGFKKLISFVRELDVCVANAENAVRFRYFRPKIVNDFGDEAYVDIKDIRHPIIERMMFDTEYVTNDLTLDPKSNCGMLLFGLNCSGKTSLSKAVALSIIMAQCGSFVPCNMIFYPFRSIFTRIPSGDDIFKSMSTFAVEMNELRNILKRADKNSLIVGDEISHGTEVTSGVAIVSAAIIELAKRRAKFIFATHLHNIVNIKQVTSLDNVTMKHLSVYYNEAIHKLIYDRKLKGGPGSSIYGLEVCKSLDLPKDFLDLANSIRCEYAGIESNVLSYNKSRYNAGVYFDVCNICGGKTEEIHHIKQQCDSDEHGYIRDTHVHKNAKYNLINVCATCHDDIHAHKVDIKGYVQTSDGVELLWEKHNESGGEAEEKEVLRLKSAGMSVTNIVKHIGNKITTYKVNKILKRNAALI